LSTSSSTASTVLICVIIVIVVDIALCLALVYFTVLEIKRNQANQGDEQIGAFSNIDDEPDAPPAK